MPTRDQLFHTFGPKLLESMFMVLLDQINDLRPGQGKPLLTMSDLITGASNHITTLPDYDWMSDIDP
jgi:hypothetical protein